MNFSMEFKELNIDNLKNLINEMCPDINAKLNSDQISKDIEKFIIPQLSVFTERYSKVYWIEEREYIETEWKNMVSLHYINTSYNTKTAVVRLHLFSEKKLKEESYLGFFTLRPIDEVKIMLSYIYPNWRVLLLKNPEWKIMCYSKKIHVLGQTFTIQTFPIFNQDSVVASCAHSVILTLSKYLHGRFNCRKIMLSDINKAYKYERVKEYPTSGLAFQQMLEVLNNHNIWVTYDVIALDENKVVCTTGRTIDEVKQCIDNWVESALPIVLHINFSEENGKTPEEDIPKNAGAPRILHHVIQIIGYVKGGTKEKYIINDDNGMLSECMSGEKRSIFELTWEELLEIFEYGAEILYPQHEKVYIGHSDIYKFLENYIFTRCSSERTEQEEKLERELKETFKKGTNVRCLIADNVLVKNFLCQFDYSYNENVEAMVENLIKMNLPHYVWYCEMKIVKDNYLVFLANPTYNLQTTRNIFINEQAIVINKQLDLLSINTEL